MFRRNKQNKAKLEHKLYLARETPEPIFDLSDCELRHVPQGVYSLCRVFLKEVLRLDCNCLTSLSDGGQLRDLVHLKILDLHENAFVNLPDDIQYVKNLKELYLNDNQLKQLPQSICNLTNLIIVNLANNALKTLPENFGNLKQLKLLSINGNKHLKHLPKSMCNTQQLTGLEVDDNYIYPPSSILRAGAEATIRYICNDVGVPYEGPKEATDSLPDYRDKRDEIDAFEAKIWKLENIKQQRLQDFLEMERAHELLQQQEFELANANKVSRGKLLADIAAQQSKLDSELIKLQQEKEVERFRLVEQVLEAEQNADVAIKQLLDLNSAPLAQLLEQEREEEERLLAAADKYNSILRRGDILADMQELLQQEISKFQKFHEDRLEASRNVLEQESHYDEIISGILENQDIHKTELIAKLQADADLQKAAVGTLLERGDARSWGLLQQVRLVESQLVALTLIEMDKKKLEIDMNLNDLAEKRINLSCLLIDLLEQQKERRSQLLKTLQNLEEFNNNAEDFWLTQYQRLLEKLPEGLSEAQKNIDPSLAQTLLMNGVISYLPFLAKILQCQCEDKITDTDLREAGIINGIDRIHILDAFRMYKKEIYLNTSHRPSAPPVPVEGASAPPLEQTSTATTTECVICLDKPCEIIYLPCGHFCCCSECQVTLGECPMCRTPIERKIRIISV